MKYKKVIKEIDIRGALAILAWRREHYNMTINNEVYEMLNILKQQGYNTEIADVPAPPLFKKNRFCLTNRKGVVSTAFFC
jgi:hypothetical protein